MPWGFAAAAIGAAISAYGAISSSQAQASASKYQSQVEQNNAIIAEQNASWAAQAGNAQAEQKQLQTRAKLGGIIASEAASGLDVNSGSALDVRSSASELGQLDAINIRSNAARTAYGYNVQSTSDQNQSQLDEFEAKNATSSGYIKAAGSVISSAGDAYGDWANSSSLAGSAGAKNYVNASSSRQVAQDVSDEGF